MKYLALLATTAAMVFSTAASATTYFYTLTGPTNASYSANWQLDSNPTPDQANAGQGFAIERVLGTFPGTTNGAAYIDFFALANGGGLAISDADGPDQLVSLSGLQLYSGSELSPTLLLGTFLLTDTDALAGYSLRVSTSAGALPEPGSWALMILGVGAIGGAMRVRRTVVRFA